VCVYVCVCVLCVCVCVVCVCVCVFDNYVFVAQIYEAATLVKKDVGDVDILVNNAGIVSGKSFLECSDSQIDRTMKVNILAHFWTVKAFLPKMVERNSGHVVSIASSAGV